MAEWGSDSRSLIGNHMYPDAYRDDAYQPPLLSPVSKPARGHYVLVVIIIVIMVVGVGAIFCLCYLWEGQLRARGATAPELPLEVAQFGHLQGARGSNPPTASSFSVIMPGDDVPHFIAWASPSGAAVVSTIPELLPPPNFQQLSRKTT